MLTCIVSKSKNKRHTFCMLFLIFLFIYCGSSLIYFSQEIPRINTLQITKADSILAATSETLFQFQIQFNTSMDTSLQAVFKMYILTPIGDDSDNSVSLKPMYLQSWSRTSFNNDTLTFTLQTKYHLSELDIYWGIEPTSIRSLEGDSLLEEPRFSVLLNSIHTKITKTGQFQCFGTNNQIEDCDEMNNLHTQQDGYDKQDGHADLMGAGIEQTKIRQLKLPQAGNTPMNPDSPSNQFYIEDLTTGLAWKACSEGQSEILTLAGNLDRCGSSGSTALNPTDYSWVDAVENCAALNSMNDGTGYAGLTTWRLPTIQELISIADYGKQYQNSLITSQVRFNDLMFKNNSTNAYWSSSSISLNGAFIFLGLEFTNLGIDFSSPLDLSTPKPVRCVGTKDPSKLIQKPTYQVTDETVIDASNQLIWQKEAPTIILTYTEATSMIAIDCRVGNSSRGCIWRNALNYCRELDLGGSTEWRLPNVKEFVSLLVSKKGSFNLPPEFTNSNVNFWTSTTKIEHLNSPADISVSDKVFMIQLFGSELRRLVSVSKESVVNNNITAKCVRNM